MSKYKDGSFFEDVWEVTKLIPKGRVTSYGAIAEYLGSKGSARMVGWAMNASHKSDDVPAHRVVNRKGLLTGKHHFGEFNEMQSRLEDEGIIVKENQIQNMKEVYWDPNIELEL
ncbi:MGMT family protein [Flammeovirga agarivorans]|uniref:MGMT family protein n=1 Tax=Flammeovirga agarivorans TaxID=2726742 RepID=A0A7X8SLZ8_9BACT|nr:MGMT family protein [Flammeovirga agarivorans]NLR92684.1 MGMT family protein [Flammeovirga agarivorans]